MTSQPLPTKRSWIAPAIKKQLFYFLVLLGLLPSIQLLFFYGFFGFPISIKTSNYRTELAGIIMVVVFIPSLIVGVVSLFQRKWENLIGLAPALYPVVLFGASLLGMKEEEGSLSYHLILWIYFLLTQIVFLYFIIKGRMRSLAFICFLGILFFVSRFLEFLLFLLYAGIFKLIYLAIQQNIDLFKKLGFKDTVKLAFQSFLYWSPLLIFIIPGAILSNKIYKQAIDAVYIHTFVKSTDESKKYEIVQFEKDLKKAMNKRRTIVSDKLLKEKKKLINQFHKTKKVPKQMAESLGKAIPDDLTKISSAFKPEKCGFLAIKCGVKNMVKNQLNEGYKNQRIAAIDDFQKESEAAIKKYGKDGQRQIGETFNRTEALISSTNKNLQASLSFTFWSILLINLVMDLLFAFIILKSFLYVFARVAFTDDSNNYVTFLEKEGDMPKGTIQKFGNQYTIIPKTKSSFFISRTYEPSGRAPKFALPQRTKAFLARIFTRNYTMNEIVVDEGQDVIEFRAIGSQEFVEWDIKEGEEVIFHFSNFVGMSEDITLSALISLRLTSLLMGRIIFTTAKGPGKLILSTQGKPAITGDKKANTSVATSRIIAWDKNARFHVESELNLLDIFMSGIYLKKKEDDVVLIDADVRGRAKSGIVQFIKHFILPI